MGAGDAREQQCNPKNRSKAVSQEIQNWLPAVQSPSGQVHPVCGGCERHQSSCIYSRPSPSPNRAAESSRSNRVDPDDVRPKANTGKNVVRTTVLEPAESRKRRFLELKLFHHYITKTSMTFLGYAESMFQEKFATIIPGLALNHDALLYSIYTTSALHLAKTEPHDREAVEAYQKYMDLTLRGHRNDVAHINQANADAACLTSTFLRVCAFAILQERPLSPYTPPTHWLQMTGGSVNVFKEAWPWIVNNEESIARALVMKRTPVLVPYNEELFLESHRQDLLHLLRRSQADEASEPWDEETQEAYKTTISYLGGAQIAIDTGEAPADICRRLIVFPMLIKKRFIDLIEEQRPRALVVLAHFFALLARFSHYWWMGDTGKREIRGIQTILPDEWQDLMGWPLAAMEEEPLLV
ncbi:MAG: hypothetical protein M1813_008941 [Trichoglossum hirsutum]|nr:MAG: hypothetical protein M1813_008941 [Trichoglossum hirsutum]